MKQTFRKDYCSWIEIYEYPYWDDINRNYYYSLYMSNGNGFLIYNSRETYAKIPANWCVICNG